MLMYMPIYKHIKNNCLFNYAIWYIMYKTKHIYIHLISIIFLIGGPFDFYPINEILNLH